MKFRRFLLTGLILFSWVLWGFSVYYTLFHFSFNPSVGWTVEKQNLSVNRAAYKDPSGNRIATPPDGLQQGDAILAVRTTDGRLHAMNSISAFGEVLRLAHPGDSLKMSIRRKDGSPAEIPVQVTHAVWTSLSWLTMLVLLVPMVALLAATMIGLLKPDDGNAFCAALLFLSFVTIFQQSEIILFPPLLRDAAFLVGGLLNSCFVYILMRFFLLFPAPSLLERRAPWLKHALLLLTALSTIPDMVSRYALHYSFAHLNAVPSWIRHLSSFLSLLMFLLAMISLILNTFLITGKDERRRMRILLIGSLLGLLPTFLFSIYFSVFSSETPSQWLILLIVLTLSVFPLSFIYAVVKHRVLGIRLILRQGLKYSLVSQSFLALEGILIFLVIVISGQPFLRERFPHLSPSLTAALIAGLVLLCMAGLREINRRIFPLIDRRFFRESYNAQKVLTDLRRSVRQLAAQPDRLFPGLAETIGNTLFPEKVVFFLRGCRPLPAVTPDSVSGALLPPETTVNENFYAACLYQLPVSRKASAAVTVTEAPESLSFTGGSFIVRHLESVAREEPEALEVYLDDPKSWLQALVRDSSQASHAYEERCMLERLQTRLLIPLVAGQQLLGFISLGEKRSEEPYSHEDRELLLTLAEQIAVALDYLRLMAQVAEQEKLKREVEIAKEVQARLFPQEMPPVAGLDYAGHCRAARGVGGDYYDFLLLESGKIGLALGDISGKGIGAALLMAVLQASLRSHAPLRGEDLELLFRDLNRLMCASVDGSKYATFFYGLYHGTSGQLSYVNAGHNPPLLFRRDERRVSSKIDPSLEIVEPSETERQVSEPEILRLEATGMTIGLFLQAPYEKRTLTMQPGDILVLYSDGVTEAQNGEEEEFGEERLQQVILQNCQRDAQGILQSVVDEVSQFVGSAPQYDDLTLVVAKACSAS